MKNAKLLWRLSGYFLIAALFLGFGGGTLRAQDTYEKVTDASTLANGDEVIIVAGSKAFDGEVNSNWGKVVDVTVSSNSISTTVATLASDYTKPHAFIVENVASDGSFSLKGKLNEGYLAGGAKKLTWSETSLKVGLHTNGLKDLTATADTYLRHNTDAQYGFRWYAGTTGVATELYKKQVVLTTPFVSPSERTVSYKIQPTENLNETLSFMAGNLENDLTVSVGQNAVIAVNPTTISKEATSFDLTLTTSGLAEGEYSDIITIKSGAETMATVTVNLKVELSKRRNLFTAVSRCGRPTGC